MDFGRAYDPLRALGVAARLLARAPLTLVVGGALVVLTDVELHASLESRAFGMLDVSFGCCVGLLALTLGCLLQIGYAAALERVMVTGEEEFRDLFLDRGLWLSLFLTRLLQWGIGALLSLPWLVLVGVPAWIGHLIGWERVGWLAGAVFAIAYLPIWGYAMLGLFLVREAVVIEGKAPAEALERSWQLADGRRGELLVYAIVTKVAGYSGLLACGVGLLVTKPWALAARYESYLRFARAGAWARGGQPEPWIDRSA